MSSLESLSGEPSRSIQFDRPDDALDAEKARHRLIAIVESSVDAIVGKDLNGIITSWNQGAERIFGYSEDEVLGKPVIILIPPEYQDEEPNILERIRRGERIAHYETVRRRKDGTLIDISLSVSPVRDGDGRIVGASKIARDITDRKRTERALARHAEEQAALYRLTDRLQRTPSVDDVCQAGLDAILPALQCNRASILLFDGQGVMRFVAWRGLSDVYRRAVDGHSPWTADVVDPSPILIGDVETAPLPDALKAIVLAERIHALSFTPLISDGRLIGKFMAYYDAPHDFTDAERDLALTIARQLGSAAERIRAEAARAAAENLLRESERRLELALGAGKMGAWEWNIVTGDVIWSAAIKRIHGLDPDAPSAGFADFRRDIHPDDAERVFAYVKQALEDPKEYHLTYRIITPDGQLRWLEAFGQFMLDDAGKPQKLAGICMDITDRKLAEAQRDLLVAELSHRVKNTLATVISVAAQSFSRGPSVDESRRSFESRIRALARAHTRLAEGNWSGASLQAILLDELAPYRLDDGSNVRISGPDLILDSKFAVALGMAFHELSTNAAKYGALSANGVVSVAVAVTADRHLHIRWVESGGPAVGEPARSGFGRMLLEQALASDLRGQVQMKFTENGLSCEIVAPLPTASP
jgi:PAS domain S-box-containing protein